MNTEQPYATSDELGYEDILAASSAFNRMTFGLVCRVGYGTQVQRGVYLTLDHPIIRLDAVAIVDSDGTTRTVEYTVKSPQIIELDSPERDGAVATLTGLFGWGRTRAYTVPSWPDSALTAASTTVNTPDGVPLPTGSILLLGDELVGVRSYGKETMDLDRGIAATTPAAYPPSTSLTVVTAPAEMAYAVTTMARRVRNLAYGGRDEDVEMYGITYQFTRTINKYNPDVY